MMCMTHAILVVYEQLNRLEVEVESLKRSAASAQSGSTAELATVKADAETAHKEVEVSHSAGSLLYALLSHSYVMASQGKPTVPTSSTKFPASTSFHFISVAWHQELTDKWLGCITIIMCRHALQLRHLCNCASQALRKELESERAKLGRALEEAKKRMAKAQKAQHAAEVAAAEVGGVGDTRACTASSQPCTVHGPLLRGRGMHRMPS